MKILGLKDMGLEDSVHQKFGFGDSWGFLERWG
jgi:hypothetical protein